MGIKRLFGSVAIAGIVGASTLGIGAGTANASPAQSGSESVAVQPVDWHGGGRGHGYGYGHDYGRGGYWGGWHGDPYWHPWGWPWHW
jgi:hypothetical protein